MGRIATVRLVCVATALCLSFVGEAASQRAALRTSGEGYASAADEPGLDLPEGPFTVEAWIKHDGTSDAGAILLTKRQDVQINYQLALAGQGEEVPVRFTVGADGIDVISSVGVPADRWTHVAGVFTGTQMLLYVNGVLDGTRTVTVGGLDNDGPLMIGTNDSGSADYYRGQVDDVRLWNKARTALEIRSTMYGGLNGTEANLAANYPFSGHADDVAGGMDLDLVGDAVLVTPGVYPIPPDLFAAPGDASVRLDWAERLGSAGANQASQFRLYRSTTLAGTDRQLVATLSAGTAIYVDAGLTNGATYYYEITSADATGAESDFSYAVSATPHGPGSGGGLLLEGRGFARVSDRPSLSLNDPPIAVEAWIRHDGASDADAIILTKNEGVRLNYQLSLAGEGAEAPVKFSLGGEDIAVTSTAVVPANQWTHVAGTYDGSQMALYVNGVPDGTRTVTLANLDNEGPLMFGTNTEESGRFFSGQIDEARIWAAARTPAEIQQAMNRPLSGSETGLAGNFRFDEVGAGSSRSSDLAPATVDLLGDASIALSTALPTDAEADGPGVPEALVLRGNGPNPFRLHTTIRFGLREAGRVRLAVYDLLGRRIAVLVDGERRAPGWHTVPFDGSGLPSGTYILRAEAGQHTATSRMVLVR